MRVQSVKQLKSVQFGTALKQKKSGVPNVLNQKATNAILQPPAKACQSKTKGQRLHGIQDEGLETCFWVLRDLRGLCSAFDKWNI